MVSIHTCVIEVSLCQSFAYLWVTKLPAPPDLRCANLLKLPDYVNYHTLKAKVLQAIRPVAYLLPEQEKRSNKIAGLKHCSGMFRLN